jgi:hypothetical protein
MPIRRAERRDAGAVIFHDPPIAAGYVVTAQQFEDDVFCAEAVPLMRRLVTRRQSPI